VLVLKQREGLEAEEPSKKASELSELDQEQRSRGFYRNLGVLHGYTSQNYSLFFVPNIWYYPNR